MVASTIFKKPVFLVVTQFPLKNGFPNKKSSSHIAEKPINLLSTRWNAIEMKKVLLTPCNLISLRKWLSKARYEISRRMREARDVRQAVCLPGSRDEIAVVPCPKVPVIDHYDSVDLRQKTVDLRQHNRSRDRYCL